MPSAIGIGIGIPFNQRVGDPTAATQIINLNIAGASVGSGRYYSSAGSSSSLNMVAECSGKILGVLTSGTATEFYANGPSGLQVAKRLQIPNTAVYDIFRDNVIPAGPYTIKVKAKSNAGQGTANFKFGLLSGGGSMSSVSTTEGGWTTLTTTATPNGTTDQPRVCIQNDSGASIDILIDEVQWYLSSDTVPDFSSESIAAPSLRHEIAHVGSLVETDGFLDTTAKMVRGFVPFDTFPLNKTFSDGVTMMALVRSSDTTSIASKILTFDGTEGTLTIGTQNGKFYAAPILARSTTNPAHWLANDAWHVLTLRVKNGDQAFFVDTVKHTAAATASPTIPARNGLMVGNDDSTVSGRQFLGDYSQIKLWSKWLTDSEVVSAVGALVSRHVAGGGTAPTTSVAWFAEGDSITENRLSGTDGPNYQAQYMQGTPDARIVAVNNAVSGSGLSHLTTRLTSTLLTDRIAASVAAGNTVVASVLIGANGIPTIAELETYWNALKTAGALVVACTILPREDASGGPVFNAARATRNAEILASSVPDAVADLAADASIGVDGAPTVGTYYYDLVHLNAAGHAIAADIVSAAVLSLLPSSGSGVYSNDIYEAGVYE